MKEEQNIAFFDIKFYPGVSPEIAGVHMINGISVTVKKAKDPRTNKNIPVVQEVQEYTQPAPPPVTLSYFKLLRFLLSKETHLQPHYQLRDIFQHKFP